MITRFIMAILAVAILAFLAADPVSSLGQTLDTVSNISEAPALISNTGEAQDQVSGIGHSSAPISNLEQAGQSEAPVCGKQVDAGGSPDLSCEAQCKVVDRRTAYAGCRINNMRGYRIVLILKIRCTNPCTGESWEYRVEDPGECIPIRIET